MLWGKGEVPEAQLLARLGYEGVSAGDSFRKHVTRTNNRLAESHKEIGEQWEIPGAVSVVISGTCSDPSRSRTKGGQQ
jgi:hypothetical protein